MESDFKSFSAALADDYRNMALINFAMEYFNTYEGLYDAYESIEEEKAGIAAIVSAAEKLFDENADNEEIYRKLSELRSETIDRMEMLSACTDYFGIHEYILNRIELRYGDELGATDNDEEARKILQYIFEPKDNMEVNLRIRDMLACLPVRMTSSRFFDLLQESFTIYKGSEKNSLDSHVYMIRSAAGLGAENNDKVPQEIKKYIDIFENIDYKNITAASYEEYAALLDEISDRLVSKSELVLEMMEMLNDLSTAFLTATVSSGAEKIMEIIKPCTEMVSKAFEKVLKEGEYTASDQKISDECFAKLEGRAEKLSGKIAAAEGRLDSYKNSLQTDDSLTLDTLLKAEKLMSSSEFVKLDEGIDITECSDETVNAAYLKLSEELKAVFEKKEKIYRRAVMASVLKELPVFFVSHTEVMNYVRFTLDNCKDEAEKTASLRIFGRSYEK